MEVRKYRKAGRKRSILSLWLVLAMIVSMTAGMSLTVMAADHDIVVLYTNDVHCAVDDNIGYASLALYKKQMQQQTPYVTLVDAGDAIQGAPIGTLSDGGYLVDIMNRVGYDFAIPGNHEFDYGMDRFLQLSQTLNCGYYSCNFMNMMTGKTVFAPYKMVTYGDTKVAFLGVSTPESFTKSTPAYFQDGNGKYLYGFCEDESGQKLYTQVQNSVDAARAEGADYVIMVGHMGKNGVTQQWSAERIIQNTNGISACIDGHSHEIVASASVQNKDGQQILITQAGTKLKNIGKLMIRPDGTITTELVSSVSAADISGSYTVKTGDTLSRIAKKELGSYQRWREIYQANREKIKNPDQLSIGTQLIIPGKATADAQGKAVDYELDQYIKGIQAQYSEMLKVVLGHTDYELTVNNPTTGKRAVRNAETNLGDLTADAYRYVLGADIGLSNGGGIRSSIKAGDITYNDTLAVFPYGNMGCVVEATGQKIKDALEMGVKNAPEESGGFLHVSGMTYVIDTAVPSHVQIDDKGNFVKVDGAYRVSDIKVNGEAIDLNKIYTVASHNYLLKLGGDGINIFQDCNITRDEVMTDVDLLSTYLNSRQDGKVSAEYENPLGQGRITVK